MLIAATLAGVLLAQAAAPAVPPAVSTPAAAKAEKPKKPKMVCTEETSTDSFIPKRVCRTPEQVEAERRAGRQVADDGNDVYARCGGRPCQ